MNEPNYKAAHKHSINNKNQIMESGKCGCFFCLAIFLPEIIEKWSDENDSELEQTAICPYCNKETIIGDASGYTITVRFLHNMYKTWFRK